MRKSGELKGNGVINSLKEQIENELDTFFTVDAVIHNVLAQMSYRFYKNNIKK
jgi:hypothetical protein